MYRYYVETAVETDQKKSFPLFKLQFPLRGRRKAIYLAYHIRGEHVWYLMAYPILQQKSVQIELMTGLAWPGMDGWSSSGKFDNKRGNTLVEHHCSNKNSLYYESITLTLLSIKPEH
jgi:hypothetical protein